jgi:hypothetical protein
VISRNATPRNPGHPRVSTIPRAVHSLAGIASGVTSTTCTLSAGATSVAAGAGTSMAQYGLSTGRGPLDDPLGYFTSAALGGLTAGWGGAAFDRIDSPLKFPMRSIFGTNMFNKWADAGFKRGTWQGVLGGLSKGAGVAPVANGIFNLVKCQLAGQC